MEKRRIAILGSTGSIGRQTLDVIREHPDLFEVELLTCNSSFVTIAAQAREFDANNVVICDETRYKELSDALGDTDTKVFAGMKSVCDLVTSDRVDIVVASMVGFSGLAPTIAALKAGKVIALANKETLVAAGSIVMGLSRKAVVASVDNQKQTVTTKVEITRYPQQKKNRKDKGEKKPPENSPKEWSEMTYEERAEALGITVNGRAPLYSELEDLRRLLQAESLSEAFQILCSLGFLFGAGWEALSEIMSLGLVPGF